MTTPPSSHDPAQPTPDPDKEPGTRGATGGASITGEVHVRPDHDNDSANGSENLVQPLKPDTYRDGDIGAHGSR